MLNYLLKIHILIEVRRCGSCLVLHIKHPNRTFLSTGSCHRPAQVVEQGLHVRRGGSVVAQDMTDSARLTGGVLTAKEAALMVLMVLMVCFSLSRLPNDAQVIQAIAEAGGWRACKTEGRSICTSSSRSTCCRVFS